jgi:hypothetical protein
LPELSGVEFPYSKKIKVPQTAKGKWVEDQIKTYKKDSDGQKMYYRKRYGEKYGTACWQRNGNCLCAG